MVGILKPLVTDAGAGGTMCGIGFSPADSSRKCISNLTAVERMQRLAAAFQDSGLPTEILLVLT